MLVVYSKVLFTFTLYTFPENNDKYIIRWVINHQLNIDFEIEIYLNKIESYTCMNNKKIKIILINTIIQFLKVNRKVLIKYFICWLSKSCLLQNI